MLLVTEQKKHACEPRSQPGDCTAVGSEFHEQTQEEEEAGTLQRKGQGHLSKASKEPTKRSRFSCFHFPSQAAKALKAYRVIRFLRFASVLFGFSSRKEKRNPSKHTPRWSLIVATSRASSNEAQKHPIATLAKGQQQQQSPSGQQAKSLFV